MNFRDTLIELNACVDAVKWVGDRDEETAWAECKRADWMLWLAERRSWGSDKRLLTRAACICARTALRYVPVGEDRPRLAIEAAERWADDPSEVTRALMNAAVAAAWSAAGAAAGAAAVAAARFAAMAAAGDAARFAARFAAWSAAMAAAGDAARFAARFAALAQMADLIRPMFKVTSE
jgi:hypothetical protein